MAIRSFRERMIQTFAYETIGLAVISPLIAIMHGLEKSESMMLLITVAMTCLVWAPIHNTFFDMVDLHCSGRVASDRPQCWRVVHAGSLEITSTLVTVPVIIWFTGYGFWQAVLFDLTLTLAYTAYAYLFHLTYDWFRPVEPLTSKTPLTHP